MSKMKRLFSFIIILQLFTNHEAFAELAKVPFLFHHFNETGSDKSFLKFMKEHYTQSSNEKTDNEHGKLPFKHSDDGNSHHTVSVSIKDTKTEAGIDIKLPCSCTQKFQVTNESNFPTYSNNIWQPPKLI